MYAGDAYADEGVYCSEGMLVFLPFLNHQRASAIAMSTTAAAPIAIPAMAPPERLLPPPDDLEAGEEVCDGTEVEEGEDIVDEGGIVEDVGGAEVEVGAEVVEEPLAE